ncbi:N5-glutamine methyltransferase family protein [Acanthopleuribacter pedis]|uniref:peptide chain release factor N(5)-glutamine methyltransferase n=1 Tax=Acanthopleuribacter pedis TaxID=442870 RepID=A0A8J7U3W6_9BACT|nr:HemK/PrmC family methyltransferase [Acanthopleuribacter pedis]MBO1319199.1 peptide chain release factor N(5)-glutamine methyltransferase [Acanthopleuribacter pedis]
MNWQTFLQKEMTRFPEEDRARTIRHIRELAANLSGKSSSYLATAPEWEPGPELLAKLSKALDEALEGRPWAYLLGSMPFHRWTFKCDERALIPRVETEWLVDAIIKKHGDKPPARLLDLCCGSGNIGLSLAAAFPDSHVVLTDISQDALDLAGENAELLGVADRVTIRQGDLWDCLNEGERFDCITANPPYVDPTDWLQPGVAEYEPHVALYSEDRGRAHIKLILNRLNDFLTPEGYAAFELSHEHQHRLGTFLEEKFDRGDYNWGPDPSGVYRFLWIYSQANKALTR